MSILLYSFNYEENAKGGVRMGLCRGSTIPCDTGKLEGHQDPENREIEHRRLYEELINRQVRSAGIERQSSLPVEVCLNLNLRFLAI